jgi:hypothetical protein
LALAKLDLKRRRLLELLASRRAELATGEARDIWRGFKYAFRDEDEYLADTCPFPLQRACACTHHGIAIRDVVALAQEHEILGITDVREINPWKFTDFAVAFGKKFGHEAMTAVFAKECGEFPPVLLLDFKQHVDAANYIRLKNCSGRLFFGLPHLVIGDYLFAKDGEILPHRNAHGVELMYSLQGSFELTYQQTRYRTRLDPRKSMLVFDARKKHGIRLLRSGNGRLLMARYCPTIRNVKPGHPRNRKASKQPEMSATH